MKQDFISVVICSIDPWKFAQACTLYEGLLANVPHEIIGIHDARSLAEAYNRGTRRARGGILIFSHDDIIILDTGFAQKILRRLQDFDILGFAGTRCVAGDLWWSAEVSHLHGAIAHRHDKIITISLWDCTPWPVVDGIQAIDGLCIMARREAVEEIRFDDATFDGFHLYDLDFSFSAWQAGKKIGVCCDIPVVHASMGSYDKNHSRYGQLFIQKHRDALPTASSERHKLQGVSGVFSNHQALCAAWREDVFRRAWLTYLRRSGEEEG